MTFEEFVEYLYKIGWRAVGDAQHKYIRELWDILIERGADGSVREPTIITSFPMRDAYPVGHQTRRPLQKPEILKWIK